MSRHAPALVVLLFGWLVVAAPACSQNLIPDGDFDLNVTGWNDPGSVLSWSPIDAADESGSGSARLRYAGANANSGVGAGRCVPIVAGRTYYLAARVLIPAGQARTGSGNLFFSFYSGENCSGARSDSPNLQATAPGTWSSLMTSATAPAGKLSAYVVMNVMKTEAGGSFDVHVDDLAFGTCIDGPTSLCLDNQRFLVRATFRTAAGGPLGTAESVPLRADSGLFWFFGPENLELLVKVLDGCPINARHWVFLAATTDVEYHLEITDTATGAVKTYSNPLGVLSAARSDVDAFSGCD